MKIFNEYLYNAEHAHKMDKKTLKSYRINLKELNDYMFNSKEYTYIDDLKSLFAEDYLISWLRKKEEEGLSASSLNSRISSLRSVYKFCCSRGYLSNDVSKNIPMFKSDKQEKKTLTFEECKQLLNYVNSKSESNPNYETKRLRLIVNLFLMCGLRIEELSLIQESDIDLDNRKINLKNTKFDKIRTVSITSDFIYMYNDYITYRNKLNEKLDPELHEYLFISKKYKVISTEALRISVYKAIQECGLPHVTIHSLRHSYAYLMLENGSSLNDLCFTLGHNSINTTKIYIKQNKEKDMSVYNPLFNNQEVKKENNIVKPTISKEKNSNLIQIKFNNVI